MPFSTYCNHCANRIGNVFALKSIRQIPSGFVDDSPCYSRFFIKGIIKGTYADIGKIIGFLNDHTLEAIASRSYKEQLLLLPKSWQEGYEESEERFLKIQSFFKETIISPTVSGIQKLKLLREYDNSIGFFILPFVSDRKITANSLNAESDDVATIQVKVEGVYYNANSLTRVLTELASECPRAKMKAEIKDPSSVNPLLIKAVYERGNMNITQSRKFPDRKLHLQIEREYVSLREYILEEDIEYYGYKLDDGSFDDQLNTQRSKGL